MYINSFLIKYVVANSFLCILLSKKTVSIYDSDAICSLSNKLYAKLYTVSNCLAEKGTAAFQTKETNLSLFLQIDSTYKNMLKSSKWKLSI